MSNTKKNMYIKGRSKHTLDIKEYIYSRLVIKQLNFYGHVQHQHPRPNNKCFYISQICHVPYWYGYWQGVKYKYCI